jgi:lysophospholipase L1-like esterase
MIGIADPRLTFCCPQPVDVQSDDVRLERFPRPALDALRGQIGPSANARSASGCALRLATDSPWIDIHLLRLRHHQPFPAAISLEVDGGPSVHGPDLRAQQGEVTVRLTTGLERGGPVQPLSVWMPLISTCALAGITVADGAHVAAAPAVEPRWLAIGDSLTQGFSVQSPLDNWVHRLSRQLALPCWNLGIGGVKIDPAVFRWALATRTWDLVTIGLGSNHAWQQADADAAGDLACTFAEMVLAGEHRRVLWFLPPPKPYEEGKGPTDFQGVPLVAETGVRLRQVREALRQRLAAYAPRLELVEGHVPTDLRMLPDGLHPVAHGSAIIAERLATILTTR